ncbi:hypothetical protein PCANC_08620 [Puccinia coronata f. sp. avenae]|uniref:Uncharacterized protein n=1 Tax=Puccinia coronata f. sp. avenae TaxID=200324 RepID=A0A2N5UXP3_9BASI|nr:hypothetical protein PCANC_08620 [Puccinia coronata f. sp. avenae]
MALDNSENSQPPLSANGPPLPSANGPPPPRCQANGPPLYQLAPDNNSMGPPPQHLQQRHTILRADPLGCNKTASQGMALDNSVNGPSTSSTNGPPSANGPPPPSANGPPPPSANGLPRPSANGPPPPIANGPPPPSANGNTVLHADPVEVIPTLPPPPKIPAKSSKGSQDFRLSAQEMSAYEKLSSQTLCNLQSTHIMYCKLTEDFKQEAKDLYLEYHWKILLLSLKYSRPAVAIAKYLGQGRMQRTNQWNDYVANSKAAQEEFDCTAPLPAESNDTPVVFIRKKKLPLQTKMMADVETWKITQESTIGKVAASLVTSTFRFSWIMEILSVCFMRLLRVQEDVGLDSGTPKGRAHTYLHAQKKWCAAAARRFGKACRGCTPFPAGCTPSIGVHMACNPARQGCRACTPVWRACKACTPFGQACRLCTPVGSRKPLDLRGLRLREPAQASSTGTDLGAGTETRHQPPQSARKRPATPDDYSTDPPPR